MQQQVDRILQRSFSFLNLHVVGACTGTDSIEGAFSLHANRSIADLYGSIDAAYILYALGILLRKTSHVSRQTWAKHILISQADQGWFTKLNLRGHPREHATAYAIAALHLLQIEPDEDYVTQIKPLTALLPLLTDRTAFLRWITRLDFCLDPRSILKKNLGWHYIWRGSHVGGGIPAVIGMTRHLFEQWWPGQVDVDQWFAWYFEWLDAHVNPKTGYWQRAFWNLIYRKPTLIDMGGAVHFFWIYEALGRPFPYPEAVIESTLALQRPNGLYKDHPFCIDLDGNFCLIRAYLQLPAEKQAQYRERVYRSAERNFEAIVKALLERPLEEIYSDSHGLPGALVALVECTKLPDFKYADALAGWQHPLDKVWWL